MKKRFFFPSILFLLVLGVHFVPVSPVSAAPDADLWPYWKQHDSTSDQTIDHSIWEEWLSEYADVKKNGIRRVRYADVEQEGKKQLKTYLRQLKHITVTSLSRDVQMAYWINLYNALTIDVILKHYPVDTINDIDISPGWFSNGPWDKKLITIEEKKLSLNDIEHRILRPIWNDPRIHYVVNCASLGCPNLASEPYTADNLERMLSKAARNYVNHPRGARVTKNGYLIVSSIYTWYMVDFGGSEKGVIEHLQSHANEALRQKLESVSSIYDDRYDWKLNGIEQEWSPSQ